MTGAIAFVFDRFELRPASRQLLMDGRPVPLGARAFDVLHALVEHRERLVTKNELLEFAWPGLPVEENNLQVQISSLRKVLGPTAIVTIPARGYKFALDTAHAVTSEAGVAPPVGNLPNEVTTFIGRERLLAELKGFLAKNRLLTLTGVGGIGKSRLSLRLAAEVVGEYPDGVWLVELASLSDEQLVTERVASVFDVRDQPGRLLIDRLVQRLKDHRLLIVLDNCEHLLRSCAELCQDLLKRCGSVTLLASSREALHVTGEQCYPVPGLSVPNNQAKLSLSELSRYEAIRLFVGRAAAGEPSFELTEANASTVLEICKRLDGIPLAIELAAARVRSMSLENIDARLCSRLSLLRNGDQATLPRHQTLRASMDWSYELLSQAERVLLNRLSVFAGGWTLDASEAVASGSGIAKEEVIEILRHLVEKSLVEMEVEGARYRLLETVRQYAQQRLSETEERGVWRDRHLGYFLSVAEEAAPKLRSADQNRWLDRLETEHDNLRSALAWCVSGAGDRAIGLRLAGALYWFWFVRGHFVEARAWLTKILETAPASEAWEARAKALSAAGAFAVHQGDYSAAAALHHESLDISRKLGDQHGVADSLQNLGVVALERRDLAAARTLLCEGLEIYRALGERRGIAVSLLNLGDTALQGEDFDTSRRLLEESLTIGRELGDKQVIAIPLLYLGEVACARGEFGTAKAQLEKSLAMFRELGDRRNIAASLRGLGAVACAQGDHVTAEALVKRSLTFDRELGDRQELAKSLLEMANVASATGAALRAARICGATQRLHEEMNTPLSPKEESSYRRCLGEARLSLNDDGAFDLAWERGKATPLEQAVEYALESGEDR